MPRPALDAAFVGSRVGDEVVLRFSGQAQSVTLTFKTTGEAEILAASILALARAKADDEVDHSCRLRVELKSRTAAPKQA